MSDTIGDYYDRKRREWLAAYEKWQEAIKAHQANPSYENHRAMLEAEEKAIDAGNTGD